MNTLAVDLSSAQSSIALFQGDVCLEEAHWTEERFKSQRFFPELEQLLARHALAAKDLDQLIAGCGPGNFTGLRISMATLRGLALPFGTKLRAYPSGLALAWEVLSETHADSVTVSGDARRGTFWTAHFQRTPAGIHILKDWHLVETDAFETQLPDGAVHVSPEWERLAPSLRSTKGWITQPRYPRAAMLQAIDQLPGTEPLLAENFAPIYLHPAVALPTTNS